MLTNGNDIFPMVMRRGERRAGLFISRMVGVFHIGVSIGDEARERDCRSLRLNATAVNDLWLVQWIDFVIFPHRLREKTKKEAPFINYYRTIVSLNE